MFCVHRLTAFNDNYIWAIQDGSLMLVIDPGMAAPVQRLLAATGCSLERILLTHAHPDHCAGIPELCRFYPRVPIIAAHNTPLAQEHIPVRHAEQIRPWPALSIHIIATPGHTQDHICFYIPQASSVFSGDALFSAGCGRLFDGTAHDLLCSMRRFRELPADTWVYCAHEYTKANLAFVQHLWPEMEDVRNYKQIVTKRLKTQQSSIPSTIYCEKKINPFLNWDNPLFTHSLSRKTGQDWVNPAAYLHYIRAARTAFKE